MSDRVLLIGMEGDRRIDPDMVRRLQEYLGCKVFVVSGMTSATLVDGGDRLASDRGSS